MAKFDPDLWTLRMEADHDARQALRVAAFDRIKPTGEFGWKGRISAIVSETDFETLNAACIHFTGAGLTIEGRRDNGDIWVTSPGYYATIGA